MDPSDHHCQLLTEVELAEFRQERGHPKLRARWRTYVLGYRSYRRLLSDDDAAEIVSEAIDEELGSINDPLFDAATVSVLLRRAFNRVRARYARLRTRQVPVAQEPSSNQDMIASIYYKEMARALRGFIGQAIDELRSRDRNIIVDGYRLDRFGFVKHGPSPVFAKANGRKVAQWRARKRFFAALERVLTAAVAQGHSADLLHGVRMLIKSSGLEVPSSGRKPRPPAEK